MKVFRSCVLTACMAIAGLAQAQTIHNGTALGKAAYDGPNDVRHVSAQCHLSPVGNPDNMLAHTHVELWAQPWAEIGPETHSYRFRIVLYMTAGKVTTVWADHVRPGGIVFDATGTSDLPDMTGDQNGVKQWDGTVTFDPMYDSMSGGHLGDAHRAAPLHGWYSFRLFARTSYGTGSLVNMVQSIPVYSVIDTNDAERIPYGDEGVDLRASCTPYINGDSDTGNGSTAAGNFGIGFNQDFAKLMLAPLKAPVVDVLGKVYNYGFLALPPACQEWRVNPDLHHLNPGTLLSRRCIDKNDSGFITKDTFDPAVLAAAPPFMGALPGQFKLALGWINEAPNGGSMVEAGNKVATFQVGENITAWEVIEGTIDPSVVPSASFPPTVTTETITFPEQLIGGVPPSSTPPPTPPPSTGTTVVTDSNSFVRTTTVDGVVQSVQLCFGNPATPTCKSW